jgi:hypothetical protein
MTTTRRSREKIWNNLQLKKDIIFSILFVMGIITLQHYVRLDLAQQMTIIFLAEKITTGLALDHAFVLGS